VPEALVHFNGRMVPSSEAHLAIFDAGIVLAATVSQQTRTFRHRLWRLERHRHTVVSPTTVNTLPGVSRAKVIELCRKPGIRFVERDLPVRGVMNADEAFLASTPYCLMPVTRINGAPIGDGSPGPMVRRPLAAWSELVGLDIAKQIEEGARRRP
jgi:branched-subunit amino acid aminotransferase/4-amino-4-deoxychorismate lyase